MEERAKKQAAEQEQIDREIAAIMAGNEPEGEGAAPKAGKKVKKRLHLPGGRRKKAFLAVCLLGAVFLLPRCFGGGGEAPFAASVTPLAKQDIEEKLTVSGPVSGTDSVDVVSSLHAEITAMNVKEGDKVKKGQILAVLDRTDLEREAAIAENAYQMAVADKEEADRLQALGYEKALQDCSKAQADYDRASLLFAAGDLSQADMETAANALADAQRKTREYTVKDGRGTADPSYELKVKEAALALEKARANLEDTEIYSSIDGTVVRVNSNVGQFADTVEDDKPILSIENLEQLEMEIQVSEYSIGKVQVGQKAKITADILNGGAAEGEVVKISPTGEEKDGGSSERVIPITIRIDTKDTRLIAGITAKAEILIRRAENAFVVPVTALFEGEDGTYIAQVKDQQVERIPVDMGVDGDVNVEVIPRDGAQLSEGMLIITNPDPQLMDGAPVAVKGR